MKICSILFCLLSPPPHAQVLPKVPDQQAYYSRQMYVYNMTVVRGPSGDKLDKDHVSVYTWTENQYKKDSSVCVSVVYDALRKLQLNRYFLHK